jgi:hypothetical protein
MTTSENNHKESNQVRKKRGFKEWPRIVIPEQNKVVTSPKELIVGYIQQGLMDPEFNAPDITGLVKIGPWRGSGIFADYRSARQALNVLLWQVDWPSVSTHFVDEKQKRFMWHYKGKYVHIDLTKSLNDPHFIYSHLREIMRDLGVSEEQIGFVFSDGKAQAQKEEEDQTESAKPKKG